MKASKTLHVIVLFIVLLLMTHTSKAQLSVNINIGTPPQWGPVGITDVRYYYLPGVEAYYDIQTAMFIYSSGGVWLHRNTLPARYRNYDLYYGYKVIMSDYRGDTPYVYFTEYKKKYNRSYRGIPQKTIGEKPGRGNSKPNKSHGHGGGKGKQIK